MKAFLENFAAIVGAVTVAILAMSVSHEYGYFWSVGRQFQSFLTTTGYLSNGVLWLPFAVFFVFNQTEWWRLKEEGPPKVNWKNWSDRIWATIGVLIFAVAASLLTWPLEFYNFLIIVIFVGIIWSHLWRRFLPKTDVEEPFKFIMTQLVRLGVPVVLGMFFIGSVDAHIDLARLDQPYGVHFKTEDGVQLRIFLRNFDKGVLLRNVIDNSVEFRKWDDVVSISKRIPNTSGPAVCWLFGCNCDSRNIAGPL